MRRILASILLILGLGISLAFSAVVTKSVQLSQDPSGPIGFDNLLGAYFSGHILTTPNVRPAPTVTGSTCGTTSPSVSGTDVAGVITVGTSATTSCVLTFGTAWGAAPVCLLTPKSAILAALSYATSTTALTITQTSTANNTIAYFCTSTS